MDSDNKFLEDLMATRRNIEAYYVASVFKDIDLFYTYELDESHLDKKSPHTFYFLLAKNMLKKGGYTKLDVVSVDTFVSTQMSENGQRMYKTYGGYDTIESIMNVVEEDNIESYYNDILKYSALIQLYNKGFDLETNWNVIKNLNYRELNDYVTQEYAEIFVNVDLGQDKVVDFKSGIHEMIARADRGELKGLPYSSKLLTSFTNGMRRGEMTILAGKTGEGKTFLATQLVLPMMLKYKQKLLIMCNEEELGKWQIEMITYFINEVVIPSNDKYKDMKFPKKRMKDGKFTALEWELINAGTAELERLFEDGLVMFVNMTTFSMDKAIDIVRQYSTKYNIHYYILDTLKLDNDIGSDKVGDNSWLSLQQASVKLFNTIKENSRNCHILVTYQLNKQNVSRLTMESLGISKNIADVASTVILTRNMTHEEKQDDGLKVMMGDRAIQLNEDDDYMILFLAKNRSGASNKEIVLYTDKAHNRVRDVGMTIVPDTHLR